MKLYSWNVNGIRAVIRKGALHSFIETDSPDILCIQETKAQPGEAIIDLPEYTEIWNSAQKKGYSGTAIFTKPTPLSVVTGLPEAICAKYDMTCVDYGDPSTEGRILTAEYDNFWLVTVYTPNSKEDLSRIPLRHKQWDPAFLEYCRLLEQSKPVVFCGDLNVAHTEMDLAQPKVNKGKHGFTDEERAGFQAYIDVGFVDTFRMFKEGNGYYTWWSNFAGSRERNLGWRIDYFLVSAELRDNVAAADVHPHVLGSDHCPVSIHLDFNTTSVS